MRFLAPVARSAAPAAFLLFMIAAWGRADGAEGPEAILLRDSTRGRDVPIALYRANGDRPRRLAVISPGYGSPHTAYGFIAEASTQRGYAVVAIQHDLAGDPPLPSTGDVIKDRSPAWRRGADSISFVIRMMTEQGVAKAGARAALIGHSMGGDISMVAANAEPALFASVISLDNRRAPMPRVKRPKICSVRSADFPADPGVLPSPEEARRFGMRIVKVEGLRHDDMTDAATPTHKKAMLDLVLRCLK